MNAFTALTFFGKLFMLLMLAAGAASAISAAKHWAAGRPIPALAALLSLGGVSLYVYAFTFRGEQPWMQLAAIAAILGGLFFANRNAAGQTARRSPRNLQ